MIPLKELKPIAKGDPLDELFVILLSFIEPGFWQDRAYDLFYDNKPRVKDIIKCNKHKIIELIERI